MHVSQIILVEASSPEQAFHDVEELLLENAPDWSDWNCVGTESMNFAGRWSGSIFGTLDESGEYQNVDTNPNHLCYADDPALAEEVITQYLEERISAIRNYQREALDLATYTYDPYSSKLNMAMYTTHKLARLLDDNWTSDTGIYDLNNWTSNLGYFIERVAKAPENQYLIPVDFHY